MCGIVIGLTTAEHDTPEYRLQLAHLQLLNTSRGALATQSCCQGIAESLICILLGPDAQKTINILVEGTETISISAFASVLHLRGETVTTQPHGAVADGSAGDFFCWNGEVRAAPCVLKRLQRVSITDFNPTQVFEGMEVRSVRRTP